MKPTKCPEIVLKFAKKNLVLKFIFPAGTPGNVRKCPGRNYLGEFLGGECLGWENEPG